MAEHSLFEHRKLFYIPTGSATRGGLILCMLIGAITFVTGMTQGEELRTWGSFLFNLFFFFSIALGGVAFGHMQDIIGALWARPIKRLHESFGSFLPVAFGAFLFFLLCLKMGWMHADHLYKWMVDPESIHHYEGKNIWLNKNGMLLRDAFAVMILAWFFLWHRKQTLEPDLILIEGDVQTSAMFAERARKKLRYWSAMVLVVYAFCFTLLAFDMTMSLAPTWFSTLWGGWSFAIMMQTLMASLLIAMFALRGTVLGSYIQKKHFHDVGKLLFGFTVFFAYLTYAHVLTYWYTNIPEETSYLLTRLQEPWKQLLVLAICGNFIFPFIVLIPKGSKWTSWVAVPTAIVVLSAQWLTYLLVVQPELLAASAMSFPWIELGMMCGFLGMFLASFFHFARRYPMISLADPLLTKSLHSH